MVLRPDGRCFSCRRRVAWDMFCSGCGHWICDRCDKRDYSLLICGKHDYLVHLGEEEEP